MAKRFGSELRMAASVRAARKEPPAAFVELVARSGSHLPQCTLELQSRNGKLRIHCGLAGTALENGRKAGLPKATSDKLFGQLRKPASMFRNSLPLLHDHQETMNLTERNSLQFSVPFAGCGAIFSQSLERATSGCLIAPKPVAVKTHK